MANLAFGAVSITGAKQNVLNFAQRFNYENEEGYSSDLPYFARSVVQKDRAEAMDDINSVFKDVADGNESTVTLYVDFAWSAHDCLISFTPQRFPECITLMEACKTDSVAAEIKEFHGSLRALVRRPPKH